MKQAIQKAIEGGYKCVESEVLADGVWADLFRKAILLDPLFWQALGKAMGWGMKGLYEGEKGQVMEYWIAVWHTFIDHLAEGKSADEFFTELLK